MKSLTELWISLANELAEWCGVSVEKDVKTFFSRLNNEGDSFATITLPAFARDFEKSLDKGVVTPDQFLGFKRRAGLPAFLSGFLELVFDRRTSVLLSDVSTDAVFAVRQLTLFFKKLEGECTPRRNAAAVQSYINCEEELKNIDRTVGQDSFTELDRIFAIVFGDAVDKVNMDIDFFRVQPHHGPGATADGLMGNQKYAQGTWPERLESLFPYSEYVLSRHGLMFDGTCRPQFVHPRDELPVRVVLVPKTRKTPRVIAIEPTAMQYMQQAIKDVLVAALENDKFQFVGFSDQEPNRQLARQGSLTGELATLDLSEASDRVLNSLVLSVTRPWPSFREGLQATRSRRASLPDGKVLRLSKFASMGSALCFPVEAMVFTTIVLYGIQVAENRRLGASDFERLRGCVRTYGDDIIVPSRYAEVVARTLESFGLKVNADKSFWTGRFRESCGGDYYDGFDVTPAKVRRLLPTTPRDAEEAISAVDLANQLYWLGLWTTADKLRTILEKVLGPLPIVDSASQALGLHSVQGYLGQRVCPKLHRPLVKAFVPVANPPRNAVNEHWALRKIFDGDFYEATNRDHLIFSGRPSSVHIKKRWVSAY